MPKEHTSTPAPIQSGKPIPSTLARLQDEFNALSQSEKRLVIEYIKTIARYKLQHSTPSQQPRLIAALNALGGEA